jgi:hypothetical protein
MNKVTRNYKMFYRLLKLLSETGNAGTSADDLKEDLVSEFTGARTTHLSEMYATEYSLMVGAMEAQIAESKDAVGDIWRKRVMGSIGAWLRSTSTEVGDEAKAIKGIACKAAGGITDFNKIPVNKLRAIYYEFLEKQKVAKRTAERLKTEGLKG